MTGWTPGPWWAAIDAPQPSPMYRGLICIVQAGGDRSIAVVTGKPGNTDGWMATPAEWAWNGHLIAAAPDLYAALTDMMAGWAYIREQHGDLSGVGWERCQQAASDALAKARGETP